MKLSELNSIRNDSYRKDTVSESFIEHLNIEVKSLENQLLKKVDSDFLQIFVVGNPRSGTTITTQIISQGLDLGYVNNVAARFWLSPLVGLEFSKALFGTQKGSSFNSEFASTSDLRDIHEFGYFWREHLNLHSSEDILNRDFSENRINWARLSLILRNMQAHFNKPMIFKNVFGAYDMTKFTQEMPNTLWVYVERDPLDNALGILRARKKFYDDPTNWWSTIPLEYDTLKDKDVYSQVAGQVYYLNKFYKRQLKELGTKHAFHIDYQALCASPKSFIYNLQNHIAKHFNVSVNIGSRIPEELKLSVYDHENGDAIKMKESLSVYEKSQ